LALALLDALEAFFFFLTGSAPAPAVLAAAAVAAPAEEPPEQHRDQDQSEHSATEDHAPERREAVHVHRNEFAQHSIPPKLIEPAVVQARHSYLLNRRAEGAKGFLGALSRAERPG
jgi:hypothetical protein